METKQLAYFVLACHHRNHAQAAAAAGVSASTVSAALAALEAETGLTLFERGPVGRYPTQAARWLCQICEGLLQVIEAAASVPLAAELQWLDVVSPLHLMLGRLYRAAGLAAQRVRLHHPGLVARIRFHSPLDPAPVERSGTRDGQRQDRVRLSYGESDRDDTGLFLFHDDWVAVTNVSPGALSGDRIGVAAMAELQPELPPMPQALERQARQYCATHGLPDPASIDEDLGIFSRLSKRARHFVLLAPRSLVAPGLQRSTLRALPLAVPLRSPIVADMGTTGEPGRVFVDALRAALVEPVPQRRYEPGFSLRQLRYFLALADAGSMSAAARRLHVVQPALSGQLHKLEARLGQSVFRRGPQGLQPTRAGVQLEALAREAMAGHGRIARDARAIGAAQQHHIVVAVDPLACCGPALADAFAKWLEIYPTGRLRIVACSASELPRLVESGEASFLIAHRRDAGQPRIDLDSEQELGLLAARRHGLLGTTTVAVRDAAALPLILPPPDHPWRRIFERAARREGVQPKALVELASVELACAMLPHLRAAALGSRAFALACRDGDALSFHPLASPRLNTGLCAQFSADRGLRDSERMLIRLLRRELAGPPDPP